MIGNIIIFPSALCFVNCTLFLEFQTYFINLYPLCTTKVLGVSFLTIKLNDLGKTTPQIFIITRIIYYLSFLNQPYKASNRNFLNSFDFRILFSKLASPSAVDQANFNYWFFCWPFILSLIQAFKHQSLI